MCELTTGYTKPTCRSVGGIKKFIVYNLEHRDSLTVADNVITGIALSSGEQAFQFLVEQELSNAQEVSTSTRETTFFAQTVNVVLTNKTADTVKLNAILSTGFFGVIVVYENDLVRHFGLYNGMIANSTDDSGTAYGDRNGYDIAFTVNEKVTAPTMTIELAEALLIAAS